MDATTSQQTFSESGSFTTAEKLIDDNDLVNGSCRALFLSGLTLTGIASVADAFASGAGRSILDCFLLGLAGAACSFLGLAIPLFMSWGVAYVVGRRLNWVLGNPLNPSAMSALTANTAFFVFFMVASASLYDSQPRLYSFGFKSLIIFVGSFLFQFTARVAVAKKIAHHNALAGTKIYIEPPCHVRFRIRQLLILMFVVGFGLALLRESAAKSILPQLMTALGELGVVMLVVFYPALFVAKMFCEKFSEVRLKSWEQPRRLKLELEPTPTEVAVEVTAANVNTAVDPLEFQEVPVPKYFGEVRKSRFDGHRAAIDRICFDGALLAMWSVILIGFSQWVHEETKGVVAMSRLKSFPFDLLVGAVFAGIPGFCFSLVVSRLLLTIFWALFDDLCRPGTMAAFVGGAVGALGTYVLLGTRELIHFHYSSGAYDLGSNNSFPLAMILYGALVGQVSGRAGIKKFGFGAGFSEEKYQAQATSPLRNRSAWLIPMLASGSCWCVFVALNGGTTQLVAQSFSVSILGFLTGMLGCLFAVWPIANFVVRWVSVKPRRLRRADSVEVLPSIGMKKVPQV